MMNDNTDLLTRLRKHRQYRQIVDEYERCGCSFIIARKFMLTPEEATLVCGIIDILKGEQ
ncbi:hypothetical protein FMJ29_08410 [Klebsiella michiganensis]|uniref:hypothetical protein n=1 Tax=Klebsiella michiganensis TaxID=1134687 RepID=UPI001CCA24A2|nr:hypothetical protein [Klebsiella michiganensis]MBZ7458989.1 hypothetical protein [Klebsiella michiganensis]